MLSLTVDFYVRLFIRVKESPIECHKSITKYSHVFQCLECEAFYLNRMGHHFEEEIIIKENGRKKKVKRNPGEVDPVYKKKPVAAAATKVEEGEEENEVEEGEEVKEGGKIFRNKYSLAKVTVPN